MMNLGLRIATYAGAAALGYFGTKAVEKIIADKKKQQLSEGINLDTEDVFEENKGTAE